MKGKIDIFTYRGHYNKHLCICLYLLNNKSQFYLAYNKTVLAHH